MKKINVRILLREFKSIFPLPEEGIEVERREGNFFIIPSKKTSKAGEKK